MSGWVTMGCFNVLPVYSDNEWQFTCCFALVDATLTMVNGITGRAARIVCQTDRRQWEHMPSNIMYSCKTDSEIWSYEQSHSSCTSVSFLLGAGAAPLVTRYL